MLIVACIDGASTSSGEDALSNVLRDVLADETDSYTMRDWRASFMARRTRQVRSFVQKFSGQENTLLLVGKSLGGLVAVNVWNHFSPIDGRRLRYQKTALLTVDPNWPLLFDWKPNLNGQTLIVRHRPTMGVNVYVAGSGPDQQCGAQLVGPGVSNRAVVGSDHYAIVHHPAVSQAIIEAVEVLEGTKPEH